MELLNLVGTQALKLAYSCARYRANSSRSGQLNVWSSLTTPWVVRCDAVNCSRSPGGSPCKCGRTTGIRLHDIVKSIVTSS